MARQHRIAILLAAAVAVAAIVASAWLPRGSAPEPKGPPRAAIVDQLSLSFPNQGFVDRATAILRQVGYAVDYFPGEQVTVDFYRDLPLRGYAFIILRVHSALLMIGPAEQKTLTNEVLLFTGEPYSKEKHEYQQRTRQLAIAHYKKQDEEELKYYFGLLPAFIKSSLDGRFGNIPILCMGCYTFRSPDLAEALCQKGASVVVGWDGAVSPEHTDAATERLLRHLLIEGLPIAEAAAKVAQEMGQDPTYQTKLVVYPPPGGAAVGSD
jgi:hypothetical protein